MSSYAWLDYIVDHIGEREIPGPEHNAWIAGMGERIGVSWAVTDDYAWCASAVNDGLVAAGYPSTRSALARSFLNYGLELQRVVKGAIVVFPRGPDPTYGHTGIVEQVHGDGTITIVEGNADNRVKRGRYRISSILPHGIRWPPGAPVPANAQPVTPPRAGGAAMPAGPRDLDEGATGPDVEAFQVKLERLKLFKNNPEVQRYGPQTKEAVRRFQATRGLLTDGIAGRATQAAVDAAIAELDRAKADASVVKQTAAPAAGAGAAAVIVGELASSVSAARDTVEKATAAGVVFASIVAVALVGVGIYFAWRWWRTRRAVTT